MRESQNFGERCQEEDRRDISSMDRADADGGASPSTIRRRRNADLSLQYLRRLIAGLPLLVRRLASLERLIFRGLSISEGVNGLLNVRSCSHLVLTLRSLEEAMRTTIVIVRRMEMSYCVLEPLVHRMQTVTLQIDHTARLARSASVSPEERTSPRAHFEIARGSDEDNDRYCTKDGDVLLRVGAPCSSDADRDTTNRSYRKAREIGKRLAGGEDLLCILDGDDDAGVAYLKHARVIQEFTTAERQKSHLDVVSRQFDHVVLRFWQRELLIYLENEPDPRKIVWYVDEKGNSGKTFLSKYLIAKKGAVRFENGRSCDIKFAYAGEKIVLFDLSRSQEERFNYEVLESLKNGVMFSSKYGSAMRVYSVPHVVVFCNWSPNCEKLSQDRWDVRYIDEEQCKWLSVLASDVSVKKERESESIVVSDDYDADDDDDDCVVFE